jgi:translocation and assembly module TamA
VSGTLQAWGYLDAQLDRHRVEVTRASRSATIDLAWNSGERYRMGEVRFTGNQLPAEFLNDYLPWRPDSFYSVDDLLQFQQRLVDADYFATVSVTPQLDARADGRVPLEVQVVPAKRTIYTASAFVSTDTGPGGKVGVQRRWLNDRGHKGGAQVEYATRREAYSLYYRIPKPDIESRLYSFTAGYVDERTDSTTSRLARLGFSEALDDWHGYARTLGLQYMRGNFEVAYRQQFTRLLYAEALLSRKRADDLLFPSRGVSVTYTARASAESPVSDATLLQLRADLKWVRPAGDRSRLILRASAGALETTNFDNLPPELRFFAGGDRSVRGYGYKGIGPKDGTGNPLGGNAFAQGNLELRFTLVGKLRGVFFFDAGELWADQAGLPPSGLKTSAGAGLRYETLVGPIRLDWGHKLSPEAGSASSRWHLTIGYPF